MLNTLRILEERFPISQKANTANQLEKLDKQKERRITQTKVMETYAEGNGLDTIKTEIDKQEAFRLERNLALMSDTEIDKQITGLFFEGIAITYLNEKDEPGNPELSNKILGAIRKPREFINELENISQEEKSRLLKEYPNYQSNNDAIALKVAIDKETEEVFVEVEGSYEMKNYYLLNSSSEADVRAQLILSREAAVKTIGHLGKLIAEHLNLSGVTSVTEENFSQVIVQPEGLHNNPEDKEEYESKFSGNKFKYVPFSSRELKEVYPEIIKVVREKLTISKS